MIRINLLPVKRKKKPKAIPPYVIYGVLVTVVVVAAAGYSFWYLNSTLSALKKQRSDNEATITELKNKIKEVENFEAQKKTLEERKNIIEQLRKNQSLPVKTLSEMSSVLPNGVWLNSMSVSGMNISLSGTGFTNEDVVNYVDNLKKSQVFMDVVLGGTQKLTVGKIITYNFTLTCRLKAL
jgi:type IV pilus assembly protein PilN